MKRSEYNNIIKKITEFESQYDCFSIKDDNPSFTRTGCECCQGLACNTYTTTGLSLNDIESNHFENILEFDICGDCLSVLINGDVTGIDYHVTEEDTIDI